MRRLVLALAAAAVLAPVTALPASAANETALTCFPLAPAEIRYDNTFGAARSGGRSHQGTDIMAPKRTVVMAVADGVVETMDIASGAGYYVRLVHEDGSESWYMHLDNDTRGTDDGSGGAETAYARGLEVGDRVVAGQIIAYVGDSGNAEWTGPHLHFEFHVGGAVTNPYDPLVEAEQRVDRLRRLIREADRAAAAAHASHMAVAAPGAEPVAAVTAVDLRRRPAAACLAPSLHPPVPAPKVVTEEPLADPEMVPPVSAGTPIR